MAAELRALAVTAMDRIEPALARLREDPTGDRTAADGNAPDSAHDSAHVGAACAVCPVCAMISVLRGERSELAARLAEQAAGLLTVLRTALDEGDPAPGPSPASTQPGPDRRNPTRRTVQRIDVVRTRATR
jgi:hypothetical protein